jgi:hypothetical protein
MFSRGSNLFFQCLIGAFLLSVAYSQSEQPDPIGVLVSEHIYKNAKLDMTINLPGSWRLLPGAAKSARSPSDCSGPLCGNPEIDATLETTADSTPSYRVFIAAYKLSSQYLDRKRNPLSKFAEVMMAGSLSGSGLAPIGTQTAIQLDRRPAYRLLAGRPGKSIATVCGYVSEVNGYVFLLVGSGSSDLQVLQNAIEAMKLGTA